MSHFLEITYPVETPVIAAKLCRAAIVRKPPFWAFYTLMSLDSHDIPGEVALVLSPISILHTSATEFLSRTDKSCSSWEQAGTQLECLQLNLKPTALNGCWSRKSPCDWQNEGGTPVLPSEGLKSSSWQRVSHTDVRAHVSAYTHTHSPQLCLSSGNILHQVYSGACRIVKYFFTGPS